MRILITAEAQFPTPPEQLPALLQGFVAWREKYRSKTESFYFFAGGGGGGGVVNVADEVELHQMMNEWPFLPFSAMTYRPVIDGDIALQQWQALLQSMMSGPR